MTQENTYHLHRLYINDISIDYDVSGTVNFSSNNTLTALSVKINNPDLQNSAILNKSIKLYLNAGAVDSVPIFSGYITSVKPSDAAISLSAHDPRILISGKQGFKIEMSDENNFDGFTLAGFLYKAITDNININNTLIGVDYLTDTYPVFSLSEYRNSKSIYDIAKDIIKQSIDKSDFSNPLGFFFDIIETENIPQLVIKKDKLLTSTPSYNFSFNEGLISYNYTKRTPVNTVAFEGGSVSFTNTPTGRNSIQITDEELSRAELRNKGILTTQLEKDFKYEIQININKCYDIGLGTIVNLNVEEDDIRGNHRVVGKTISFGKNIQCSLKLNKKPINLSEYI